MIRYYLREDPDQLTDQQWAQRLKEIEYARSKEAKHNNEPDAFKLQ